MIALKFLETEIHNVLTRLLGHDVDTCDVAKGEVSKLVETVGPMILAEAKSSTAVGSSVPPPALPVEETAPQSDVGAENDLVDVADTATQDDQPETADVASAADPVVEEVTAPTSAPEEAPTEAVEEVAQTVEDVATVQEGPEDDGDAQKQE